MDSQHAAHVAVERAHGGYGTGLLFKSGVRHGAGEAWMCSASMMAPQRGVHMDSSRSYTFELTVCHCVKDTAGKIYLAVRSRGAVNGHAVTTPASRVRAWQVVLRLSGHRKRTSPVAS